jgi:hypothetical protein
MGRYYRISPGASTPKPSAVGVLAQVSRGRHDVGLVCGQSFGRSTHDLEATYQQDGGRVMRGGSWEIAHPQHTRTSVAMMSAPRASDQGLRRGGLAPRLTVLIE